MAFRPTDNIRELRAQQEALARAGIDYPAAPVAFPELPPEAPAEGGAMTLPPVMPTPRVPVNRVDAMDEVPAPADELSLKNVLTRFPNSPLVLPGVDEAAKASEGQIDLTDTSGRPVGAPTMMRPRRDAEQAAKQAKTTSRTGAALRQQAADMARKPVAAPAVESGTLPGEEQVTTRDTLARLSPAERATVQRNFESAGHPSSVSFDDWLSDTFGSMPPNERIEAMRESAAPAAVPVAAGPVGVVGPSGLAAARRRAGKPLPEGRDARDYSPGQAREMSRNTFNPDIPMTRFGGTFTYNPNGSTSARAPDPQAIAAAAALPGDERTLALASAYYIDSSQYSLPEDMDLLRADVAREAERHAAMLRGNDTAVTEMGGRRYVPNPEKAGQARDEREAGMSLERKQQFARDIIKRYQGMPGFNREEVYSLASTPNGFSLLRQLNNELGAMAEGNRSEAARSRANNFNLTRDLNNPNYAPGMNVRSLLAAIESGNPMQAAAAYEIAGNPRAAHQMMQLASQQQSDVAEFEQQAMAVRAAQAGERAIADQLGPQIERAVTLPVGQREPALGILFRKAGVPEEQIQAAVKDAVLSHEAANNPHGELARSSLQALRNNEPAFKDFVITRMRLTPEQAQQMWEQASRSTPMAAQQAGAQAAQGIQNWASGVGSYWGGFFGGAPAQGQKK